ncbi:hypothetical protein BDFB_013050, partial [Asbolus verrucosus]
MSSLEIVDENGRENGNPETYVNNEENSLNLKEWCGLEKEEMVRVAEAAEKAEILKLQRALLNEEYRLIDEVIYPVTRSG